ncbi:hypothetical protein [Ferrovibrio sp.]|uniref:hypothetical protein n=1 Tax=Ferrovibrio sp. TaxID=1917215 RepID=UPI003D13C9B5
MALDPTQAANKALNALGAETLTDIGESSTNARRCQAAMAMLVDEVLEAHPWHFAKRRAPLAASGTAPDFGWGYAFPLPTAPWCLRPLQVGGRDAGDDWTVEGRDILANEPGPLQLVFIARVDLAQASGHFGRALGYRLAAEIGFAVTNSREVVADMWRLYERSLSDARAINAQSAPPAEAEASYLLAARR